MSEVSGSEQSEGVRFNITPRARRFGYVIWPRKQGSLVRDLVGEERSVIRVYFNGTGLGEKRVDWRNCRISVGKTNTSAVPLTSTSFVLEFSDDALHVWCR